MAPVGRGAAGQLKREEQAKVWPGRYRSPRHRMPCTSRNEALQRVNGCFEKHLAGPWARQRAGARGVRAERGVRAARLGGAG